MFSSPDLRGYYCEAVPSKLSLDRKGEVNDDREVSSNGATCPVVIRKIFLEVIKKYFSKKLKIFFFHEIKKKFFIFLRRGSVATRREKKKILFLRASDERIFFSSVRALCWSKI